MHAWVRPPLRSCSCARAPKYEIHWSNNRLTVLQPLNRVLGEQQPDGQPSLLRALLARACSVPMVFECPHSARRLTHYVLDSRVPFAPYFINFAAALQALDGPAGHQPASPVLAGTPPLPRPRPCHAPALPRCP